MKLVDGIPRRIRRDLMTPAEGFIQDAIMAIESMGADERLTRAQVMLADAKTLVSDVYEEQSP